MKFAICNLGCKVNNYESNWYSEQLSRKYEEVDYDQYADIYVINTCTVTNTAGSKSRQMIHKARKQNPDAVIAAVGCYVQMEYEDRSIFEDCDIVVGTVDKIRLPELIDEFLEKRERVYHADKINECPFETMMLDDFNQTRAYLKIQDGCNQFCSYCTIPFARGRERCLDGELAIVQAEKLYKSGHLEIVLAGIHTGRYNDGKYNLTSLIRAILKKVPELKRIRISSIEMTEVTDELIELMAEDERVARHLHIPLQVGNDRLLKLNNRPYTTEEFYNRIEYIRKRIPDISISTDIIAGLPTESDEDFNDTVDFAKKARFSFIHFFPYAMKKGTRDAAIRQQVNGTVKKERVAVLTKTSSELYNNFVGLFLNKETDVIFERKVDGWLTGHNSEYILVKVKDADSYLHNFARVKVTEIEDDVLVGHIV